MEVHYSSIHEGLQLISGPLEKAVLYLERKHVRSGTEVAHSVLPFTVVVPKNVARVGADRSEQPQIGIPSQFFKRWRVRMQEAASSEPKQKSL